MILDCSNLRFSDVGNQTKSSVIIILVIFVFIVDLKAQDNDFNYGVSSGIYTATQAQLPFWFYSNVQGKVDAGSSNLLNELFFTKTLYQNSDLQIEGLADVVLRLSENSTLFFPALSIRTSAYGLQLDVGRFNRPLGLNNHELSVGSMLFGNHHTPVPRISVSTLNFADIPYTDGYLQFKGMFSHGWFENDRHISNPFLHQKYFYLRLNLGPLSGSGGIIHNVMWGGTDPQYGRLPQSFGDYIRVISGLGAAERSNVPEGEISNVIGNSVAGYEFDLLYRHENFDFAINRLFYLEDKVSTRFRSPWDGIWTADLVFHEQKSWLNAMTYQHFNSKQQDSKPGQLIGRQSYYNHYFYLSGWSYERKVLGMPVIIYDSENQRVVDNILVGHHFGVRGKVLQNTDYKMLFTYARHYGTLNDRMAGEEVIPLHELRRDQYSWLMDIRYRLKNVPSLSLNLKLGSDFGEFFEDNFGLAIGVTWSGN